jgi:hypothetical protein
MARPQSVTHPLFPLRGGQILMDKELWQWLQGCQLVFFFGGVYLFVAKVSDHPYEDVKNSGHHP